MNHNRRRFLNRRAMWETLTDMFGEMCVYCHGQVATQIDHVIPYSYISYHGIENLRPACPRCNLLASDKVFEDFEEKYEWLRQERWRRRKQKQILTCSTCVLPYYSYICPNGILCPECTDLEYGTIYARKDAWSEWISLLSKAGFQPVAHRKLACTVQANLRTSIPIREKVSILQGYYTGDSFVANLLAEQTPNSATR